jgi:3-deoxy-7-phosphoheptulonate synthase
MFLLLRPGCSPEERENLLRGLEEIGISVQVSEGHHRTVIGIEGDEDRLRDMALDRFPGVEKVVPLATPHPLAARESNPEGTVVEVGPVRIGGGRPAVMAGPCSIEDVDLFLRSAEAVKKAGGDLLRGGAFKPRTSPYLFRGLGKRGLQILREAGSEVGLPVVTEAMDTRHTDLVAEYTDMVQIGSRNMQNYPLLEAAADTGLPILLKRGRACTVTEWLCAAEYILNRGNAKVVLCERGLVSFDGAVRNLLDLSCVPLLKQLSHLPIVIDPSHGTGRCELVPSMARAAIAAGADGVMIEVHPDPVHALSDARQAIVPDELERLIPRLHAIHEAIAS